MKEGAAEREAPREILGVVSKVIKEEGFGFIKGDDQESYFFHASAVKASKFDDEDFMAGLRVRFIALETPKGPRAVGVEVVTAEEGEDG